MSLKRTSVLRRTGFARSASRLARTALKPVSDRRKAENRLRRRVLHDAFGDNPACFVCGAPAVDGHELLSRARGGSITDPANVKPVCRPCHTRITTNPMWAESMYFALPTPPRRKEGSS